MDLTRDATWGWILLVLGVILLVFRPGDAFNSWLNTKGNRFLSIGLFAVGALYIAIGAWASPRIKLVSLAWAVTP